MWGRLSTLATSSLLVARLPGQASPLQIWQEPWCVITVMWCSSVSGLQGGRLHSRACQQSCSTTRLESAPMAAALDHRAARLSPLIQTGPDNTQTNVRGTTQWLGRECLYIGTRFSRYNISTPPHWNWSELLKYLYLSIISICKSVKKIQISTQSMLLKTW